MISRTSFENLNCVLCGTKTDSTEYTIVKDSNSGNYAAVYHLAKITEEETQNIGKPINIPKDMVVQSATVEICTQANTPVQGYVVGDKYIDMVIANSDDTHLYILVRDLIDMTDYVKKTDYASQTVAGVSKMWTTIEDGTTTLNIFTEA